MTPDTLAGRLLPCPFCGDLPSMNVHGRIFDSDPGYRVECEGKCHAMTCYWHAEAEAIAAWNTRATALEGEVSREEVARIIDPAAWARHDDDLARAAWMDQTCENATQRRLANTLSEQAHDAIQPSLAKADAILSLLASSRISGEGWRPIESAPRDGTPILAYCVHPNARYAGEDVARWTEIVTTRWIDHNGGGWTWHGICGVHTHWRPLPPPPQADKP